MLLYIQLLYIHLQVVHKVLLYEYCTPVPNTILWTVGTKRGMWARLNWVWARLCQNAGCLALAYVGPNQAKCKIFPSQIPHKVWGVGQMSVGQPGGLGPWSCHWIPGQVLGRGIRGWPRVFGGRLRGSSTPPSIQAENCRCVVQIWAFMSARTQPCMCGRWGPLITSTPIN